MHVVMLASEAVPFAKAGGLGDVLGALPKALVGLGVKVTVILPWYRRIAAAPQFHLEANLAGGRERFPVGEVHHEGARFLFVGLPDFVRDGLYGGDEAYRFVRFGQAAWVVLHDLARREHVDVVHCHDWQSALIPVLNRLVGSPWPTVFTIHNLAYQGCIDGAEFFAWTGLRQDELFHMEALEFHGEVSLLKGAVVFSDRVTTVSPSYAEEIQGERFGAGLDGVLRHHRDKLRGIVNGIDLELWNPRTDAFLPEHYDVDAQEGKTHCEQALASELGLGRPILGVVSRLVEQKGIDVVVAAAPRLIEQGYSLAVLGSGELAIEQSVAALVHEHPGRVAFVQAYDEPLAHRIYAGSMGFLMPSRFEPCGLSQLIAMRYGSIPVAHAVGGLRDTIEDGSTGILFEPDRAETLVDAVRRLSGAAVEMRAAAMRRDSSWQRSAEEYLDLYRELVG